MRFSVVNQEEFIKDGKKKDWKKHENSNIKTWKIWEKGKQHGSANEWVEMDGLLVGIMGHM